MKLKYKKIVIMVATFTMLIGLVVFSLISPSGSSAKDKKEKEVATGTEAASNPEGEKEKEDEGEDDKAQEDEKEVEQEEGIHLEKCTDEKINQLISDYFSASVACDMEKLKALVSDVSILDEDALKLKYELVEAVENIECYIAKGQEEGKYLIYVYSEVRFKDIETLAPGLSRLSVTSTEDDEYVIFFGADTEIEQFIGEADKTKDVQDLVEKVSRKLEEALSKDAQLKELNEKMTGNASKDSSSEDAKKEDSKE